MLSSTHERRGEGERGGGREGERGKGRKERREEREEEREGSKESFTSVPATFPDQKRWADVSTALH